ncbi:MAG: Tat pathway signal sequence domain protein, partial [Candidatus Melainabacteria bacterium HGW-Melainabacteria-1]
MKQGSHLQELNLKCSLNRVCIISAMALSLLAGFGMGQSADAKPVKLERRSLGGVPAQVVTVDLSDPQTYLDLVLANNAPRANSSQEQFGDEAFTSMVQRSKAATVVNGTFFSKDAQLRVMGNMVRGGTFVKYSRWENFGTSFGLSASNQPDMFTIRGGDAPRWDKHWFSITAGPRLLKDGKVSIAPTAEGFSDPHVLNPASRAALGYTSDGKTLYLVSFLAPLSLQREAEAMKALGVWQAMNLDGGASKSMAYRGRVVMAPGRRLTNAIAVYDSGSP